MRITRGEERSSGEFPYNERRERSLVVRILARNHAVLDRLILEAHNAYLASQEDTIQIYIYDTFHNWRKLANHPKRPLNSIILDPGVKDKLIIDAKDFLASKVWYSARGIPFRRGYLLYGAPGTGKTSLIHSLAGELGLTIYVISLSHPDLNDTNLREIMSELPERCIALMEDIDAALTQSINREKNSDTDGGEHAGMMKANMHTPPSKVTLSGLLNVLDGIGAQEGRLLFATTNKYSSLDPALCRPGRMDIHVEFKLASKFQAQDLFKVFYMPDHEGEGSSANTSLVDEKDGSAGGVNVHGLPSASATEPITGMLHQQHAPQLSRQTIDTLADSFAEAIPEREVSMAALQGYLMMYKTQPLEATRNAKAWVEKVKEEEERRRHESLTKAPESDNGGKEESMEDEET
jgi:chaperone BCS1